MLVRLYDLPMAAGHRRRMAEQGVVLRHAMTYERSAVRGWIGRHFSEGWADETSACFARQPVSCILALDRGEAGAKPGRTIVGFAAYEATARGFFGPMGTATAARGRGIGAALCLEALGAMRGMGYGYAVIGGVGPAEFYAKVCGATAIEGSTPGIYRDMLGKDA